MNTQALRPELPPVPIRMRKLPVHRGYPVPFFVEWVKGEPDFRIVDVRKMSKCHKEKLCWVCGDPLGVHLAFTIGPMCAVNHTSGEPPAHRDCAIFSATACPFMSRPHMDRREGNIPDGSTISPTGLTRNPGVAMVWVTRTYRVVPGLKNEPLFKFGDAEEIFYFAEGRKATVAEVMHSIDTGLPLLAEFAKQDGPEAEAELQKAYEKTKTLVMSTAA